MGSTKKVSGEKKKEALGLPGRAKAGVVSGKALKGSEIDAIFGKKLRKSAVENQVMSIEDGDTGSRPSSQKKKKLKKMQPSIGQDGILKAGEQSTAGGKARKSFPSAASAAEPGLSKRRKRTADGLTIYGEDELKWNSKEAGGTPLCPFDCDCCF